MQWICPDYGTVHWTAGAPLRFCPHCKAEKDKLEQKYWDDIKVGQRSIANNVISQILAERS